MQIRVAGIILCSFLSFHFFIEDSAADESRFGTRAFDTGMIFADEEDYQAVPKRPRTRGIVMYDRIDLSRFFPIPGDQGPQGSCASWAIGYGVRSYYKAAQSNLPVDVRNSISPAYLFNNVTPAALDPSVGCRGTTFPQALDFLKEVGSVTWSDWPYNDTSCTPVPPESLKTSAERYKISGYTAFNRDELKLSRRFKEVLATGHPIIIAMKLEPKSFNQYTGGVYKLDINMDDPNKPKLYGHGMVVVGFDDQKKSFLLYNSWGPNWGEGGKMWIDYDTFHKLVSEAYVIEGLQPPSGVFTSAAKRLNVFNATVITPEPVVPPSPAAPIQPAPPKPAVSPKQIDRETVRRDLEKIVSGIRCGKAKVVTSSDEKLTLEGFAGPQERDELVQLASGFDASVEVKLQEMAWPACEASMMIPADSTTSDAELLVEKLNGGNVSTQDESVVKLNYGDLFRIAVAGKKGPTFLQMFYLQADQSAKEIFRGDAKQAPDGRFAVSIGDVVAGLRASEPFGREAVIVFASNAPIISGELGMNLAEHDFLEKLNGALADVQKSNRPFVSRLQQVQVMGPESDALSGRWLVTKHEFNTLAKLAGADQPRFHKKDDQHSVPVGKTQIDVRRRFDRVEFKHSTISKENIRFELRNPAGLIDLTERFKSLADIRPGEISLKNFKLPRGQHRVKLTVVDPNGQDTSVEITLK